IKKLPPGCFVRAGEEPQSYWSLRDTVEEALNDSFDGDETAAVDAYEEQMLKTVESRMEADVPLGAFLSGGIDSALIVALAQKISSKPVRTFTIGFNGAENNEAAEAAAVAKHLGTEHTEMWVDEQSPLDVVPQLPEFYDEPFADASQIPTHLVSKLTREHVTVSLSGDGGDEVFGGYNRYVMAEGLHRRLTKLPSPIRKTAGRAMCATPEAVWRGAAAVFNGVMPAKRRIKSPVEKIYKLGSLAQVDGIEGVYDDLTKSHWKTAKVVTGLNNDRDRSLPQLPNGLDEAPAKMMFWDLLGYLPGDGLTKVDRASMSASLESRAPFLDHELIEFAWRLPLDFKVNGSEGKWLSRQLLARYVPRELFERPKCGFETPLYRWLRGPLKDWANDLLDENRLSQEGYFNPAEIRNAWSDHQSGRGRKHYELWSVLMFQQWLDSLN
ncbi:MAG: asparagine synthase C-terminal domain-containing protein, partial [Verrucomicrobiota bacterium]